MKIKRYFGPNTRQTMRQIRLERGPDAVILSCRAVAGGTEIITAVEPDQNPLRTRPSRSPAKSPAPSAGSDATAEIHAIRRELQAMHGLMDERFGKLAEIDFRRRRPFESSLLTHLTKRGFSSELGRSLMNGLPQGNPQRAWHEVLVRLARRIPVSDDDILRCGGRVVLLGPSGMGKTSTIAKLATRYMMRHGRDQVALIANDHGRVGGLQQLQRYAEILKLPLWSARSFERVRDGLQAFSDRSLVLIDSAGLGQRDPALIEQLKFFAAIRSVKRYLVTSATIGPAVFERVMTRYAIADLSGLILTHLDEAEMLGEILSCVSDRRVPIAYASAGMRVPEDLTPARSAKLVAASIVPQGPSTPAQRTRAYA